MFRGTSVFVTISYLAVAVALFAAPAGASAQVYKYKGKDGIVTYTDSLADLPPERRAYYNKLEAEQKEHRRRLEKAVGKDKLEQAEKEAERKRLMNAQIDAEERQRRLAAIDQQLAAIRTRRAAREASKETWQNRVTEAEKKLAEKLEAFNKAKATYNSIAIKAGFTRFPGEQKTMNEAKADMDKLEVQIDALNQELTVTIPEEARKAGIPPGWIRSARR